MPVYYDAAEVYFDKYTYSRTTNLSAIQFSNNFTLIFDMYSDDWNKPFSYQLIGNYSNDGFGIFNINYLTPTLFVNAVSSLRITNLNFNILNTVELPASATAVIRKEGFNDYYVLYAHGTFKKYNNLNVEIYSVYNSLLSELFDYDYDDTYAYFLVNTNPGRSILRINLDTGNIQDVIADAEVEKKVYGTILSRVTTINVYNDALYLTGQTRSKRTGSTIFFKDNNQIYRWKNITNALFDVLPVFESISQLNNYNIDLEGNIWILHGNNCISKFDSNLVFVTSASTVNYANSCVSIDFAYELENNAIVKTAIVQSLSTEGSGHTQFLKLNDNAEIYKNYKLYNVPYVGIPLTQTDYLREYILDTYPPASINFKFKLINSLNSLDYASTNLIYNLSSLDPGYHNFCYRVDTYQGTVYLIIDNQIVASDTFTPRKYEFSDLIDRPFFIGTAPYTYSIPIFEYLKDNNFNTNGISIKNFYLYSEPLNYFDIAFHTKANATTIQDIVFDAACGRRNYLEEIERYFKFSIPGHKSTLMNIVLKNSGIFNDELKTEIEKRIYKILEKSVPVYIKINEIKWSN
jgi:hypothetical protein